MPSGRPSIGGAYDAAAPAGTPRARSLTRVDLVEEIVPLGDRELAVLRPRAPEELIDEHAFEEDEFLPYWAELWPSGVGRAEAGGAGGAEGGGGGGGGGGPGGRGGGAARGGGRGGGGGVGRAGPGAGLRRRPAGQRRRTCRRPGAGGRLVGRRDRAARDEHGAQRRRGRVRRGELERAGAAPRPRAVRPRARRRRALRAARRARPRRPPAAARPRGAARRPRPAGARVLPRAAGPGRGAPAGLPAALVGGVGERRAQPVDRGRDVLRVDVVGGVGL